MPLLKNGGFWLVLYVLLGRLGIALVSLPPGNLTLFWLPAGVASLMLMFLGLRALGWIALGSALVNGPFFWLGLEPVALWRFSVALLGSVALDCLQPWLVWYGCLRHYRRETVGGVRFCWQFLLRGCLLAPLFTCWGFILLLVSLAYIDLPSVEPGLFILRRILNLSFSDALGIFLVVPLALAWSCRPNQCARLLLPLSLLPLPLLLDDWLTGMRYMVLPILLVAVVWGRFFGAAISMLSLSLCCVLLTRWGVGPFAVADMAAGFSSMALFILSLGGALLVLAAILVENDLYQNELGLLVEQRTLELRQALIEMERVATTDPLTGIGNRLWFEQQCAKELTRSLRHRHPLLLVLFDLDFFKRVNDQFGHQMGDQVLISLVELIQANLRVHDILARWGGEEFVLLLPDTPLPAACFLAEKLRILAVQHQFPHQQSLTISLGIAQFDGSETAEHWLSRVDQALYQAKAAGRNRWVMQVNS